MLSSLRSARLLVTTFFVVDSFFAGRGILAQTYPFKHYTTADGLVQATVEKTFQDSRGFLWFGTRSGVSKYDGNRFTNHLSSGPEKSDVKYIWEDDQHTLWFITYGNGIAKLKQNDTAFVWMKAAEGVLPDNYANVVCQDREQRLWIGTMRGLAVVGKDGSSARIDKRSGLPNDVVHVIKEDTQGHIWLGTNGGVLRCTLGSDGRLKSELVLGTPTRTILVTRNGDVLVATTSVNGDKEGRLVRFLAGSVKDHITVTIRETFKGLALFEDSQGDVWMGSSHGIYVLHGNILRRIVGENGLQNEYIYDIVEDREGTLWIGTENGVAKLPARQLTSYAVSRGSSSDIVLCMFQDSRKNLWFGTYDGLILVRPDERIKMFRETDGLRHRLVNAISEDARGNIWIGTKGGLNSYSNGRLQKMSVIGLADGQSVASIASDKDGSMWLGCIGQLVHVPHIGDPTVIDGTRGVPQDAIRSLVFDRDGTLWFGTYEHGAGSYRENKVRMVTSQDGLPDDHVSCVYPDDRGKVWFATRQGVAVLERGLIQRRTEAVLQQGPVHFVLEDSAHQTWCGTGYGVYALKGDEVQHLSTQDGLAADVVEHALVDSDGNIWFGTNAGVSRLDRRRVNQGIPVPPVYLIQISAGNNERAAVNESRFEYAENTLAFRFNALSFVDEAAMKFQWMLEGFDRDWQSPQHQLQVRYTNLSPGDYRFVVRAANRNGAWSVPAQFAFSIAPPYWRTWWFITLCALLVGLIVVLVYRYRVGQLLKIERMRARIAADLHDDIASSLASMAIYSDVIQKQLPGTAGESGELLGRIRDLSREVMENINLIVWAVDPRKDQLSEVFQYFQRHAGQLCAVAGVEFHCEVLENPKPHTLSPDHRRTIFLILKEGLNNILRHSGCSHVQFSCRHRNGLLDLTLGDNGRGFDSTSMHYGHGLVNMQERARMIGATLDLDSRVGEGTRLRLIIRMA